ncbi:MAG: methyltransferase [Oscillospiraceae bacterium]|nr:methyltransferase [Oscillospiraceae bacterium]
MIKNMTSKERVQTAFAHKQPDKTAIDFGGNDCSSINAKIVGKLREYYGLKKEPVKIMDLNTMAGILEPDLQKILMTDVQFLIPERDIFGHNIRSWKEWNYLGIDVLIPRNCQIKEDGNGGHYVFPCGDTSSKPSGLMPKGGFYFDTLSRSLPFDEDNANPLNDVEEWQVISDEDIIYYKGLIEGYKEDGRALLFFPRSTALGDAVNIPGPSLKKPKGIRDVSEWYMAPLLYPEYVHKVFEMQVDRSIQTFEKSFKAFGNDIDIVFICGTDFGTQRGPLISNDIFKDFYLTPYKKMNDWIHQHTNWKTLKHCCGGIIPLIPLLIESGFDALNPVQCSAAGMDPQRLKDEYGRDILFWGGGVDTQQTLPFGTPDEVREEVKRRCEIFSKDGGFIFNTISIIQPNVPVENIDAMLETLREYNAV